MAQAEATIDLSAIAENFHRLAALSPGAECAPVIKGDAYGHGMLECGRMLGSCGAPMFYVATLEDAVCLAPALAESEPAAVPLIAVLGGILPGEASVFLAHRLLPVLNDARQIALWSEAAQSVGRTLPAIVHVDTGMNRLGLVAADRRRLVEDPSLLEGIEVNYLMSHLTASDDFDMAACEAQRRALHEHAVLFPKAKLSLANSAGSFFGAAYRLDQFRPGQALYGINPTAGSPNPVLPAMTVRAPLLQVKSIGANEAVGYSSTWRSAGAIRLGTIGIGYANGYPRAASSGAAGPVAAVAIDGVRAPVVGRVSMDLLTVDLTGLPEPALDIGRAVEIIGPTISLAELAAAGRTIERDLSIAFGHGCRRRIIGPRTAQPFRAPGSGRAQ